MNRTTDKLVALILALFAVAGFTGALFRLAALYGVTFGLNPVNIRHGHSHLMYFGWVTPGLMLLIARSHAPEVPARTIRWVIAMALVAFVPFLLWGYESASIGSASIPLSVIAASANMVAWYFFVGWYRGARRENSDAGSRNLWDVAIGFMLLASAGAWMIALAVPLGLATPLVKNILAHAFLDWFSEGWFVFGLLGVAAHGLGIRIPRWAMFFAVTGTVVSFLLGLPGYQTTEIVRAIARVGGLTGAVGLLGIAFAWWRSGRLRKRWITPIWLLVALSAGRAGAMLIPNLWWADVLPMRVLYLHVLVLGFATLGLAGELMVGRSYRWFLTAALLVLLSLVPVTSLWPFVTETSVAMYAMAWLAPLPAIVAAVAAGRLLMRGSA